ncbi:MAG: D-sedoheptulose 7-phosphate isomerase [Verrucomicrobiota bacterium]
MESAKEYEAAFCAAADEHLGVIEALKGEAGVVAAMAAAMANCLRTGNKVCFMGNGGSAADSQHLAAELVGRFQMERKGLPSIAFTVDTSILTAVGNDYGYDDVFRRQVEALVVPGDVVVGLSTSGNSENVLRGLAEARERGAVTAALTGGDGGRMKAEGLADHVLVVPGKGSARIQEGHILVGHVLCDLAERAVS